MPRSENYQRACDEFLRFKEESLNNNKKEETHKKEKSHKEKESQVETKQMTSSESGKGMTSQLVSAPSSSIQQIGAKILSNGKYVVDDSIVKKQSADAIYATLFGCESMATRIESVRNRK